MIEMTVAEVAAAVGGSVVDGDSTAVITGGVEFDSRRVGPGGLFVAFPGDKVDGHDFAPAALAAGAAAFIATRPVGVGPAIIVEDARAAMGLLARHLVDRLPDLTIVGITGSSGKTSTKDLVGQLLARLGPTVAPIGSFNNELGLPHTVLRADAATRYLVLEMGSRGRRHLTDLCQIAPPRIGVVINVGVAHIGEFGSLEAIAEGKAELVEALPADGLAVLNADDANVRAMSRRTRAEAILVGEAADATLRADAIAVDSRGRASYTLVAPEGTAAVSLAISGRHQVGNSLLAAAVARAHGMALTDLATALGELRLVSSRRMDVFDRADGITVIDDSYNANPDSTAAALRVLVAIGTGRRTFAVLGYHAELGEQERSGHEEVGRLAAELGVDRLVVVGSAAGPIGDGAVAVSDWGGVPVQVPDQEAAVRLLKAELRAGDVVLIKGSRYRTWDIADALRGAEPPGAHVRSGAARRGAVGS